MRLINSVLLVFVMGTSVISTTLAYESKDKPTGFIIAANVTIRRSPELTSPVVATVAGHQTVTIDAEAGLWYQIKLPGNQEGWIYKTYIAVESAQTPAEQRSLRGLVSYAKKYLNSRYVYGGNSPKGFDCSGFTRFVYSKFGYAIPHRSLDQMRIGIPVARENLLPSDLVFFATMSSRQVNHVGIYIGDGKFIHASSGSRVVQIDALNEKYYRTRYQGARRFIQPLNLTSYISKL